LNLLDSVPSLPVFISIIIPNYNGAATIGKCLEAAFASRYENFEVVVVDDCSRDRSVETINPFPCRLIKLTEHAGAAQARNIGVQHAKGEIIFFVDADCLLTPDALSIASAACQSHGPGFVIGGTYTLEPYDRSFFSRFQSVFIHYSETKHLEHPDYIATHAMVIAAQTFQAAGGFWQEEMPILEDIEFSHRLRRMGYCLVMHPDLLVQHVFNYTFIKSIRNAVRKASYWTAYSLQHHDIFVDSGTASIELKLNVVCWCLSFLLITGCLGFPAWLLCLSLLLVNGVNFLASRNMIRKMVSGIGWWFGFKAAIYYFLLYPAAVGLGVTVGIGQYLTRSKSK